MEWFERPDGSVAISEVGARPPGAQLASMIGFSHDIDFYATWAELVIKGTFAPSERRYASGTAYLRGMGRGQVRTVHGIDRLQAEIGHLVVDSRLPQPGTPANSSYEGEGFITVRHPGDRRGRGRAGPDRRHGPGRADRGPMIEDED